MSVPNIDRESLNFAATTLRSAVEGPESRATCAEWFNASFLIEVAAMLDSCANALHGAASSSSTPLSSKTPTAVMCDGCGQIAARDREPESVIGYKHHCGGTWRRLSLAPLSEPTNE